MPNTAAEATVGTARHKAVLRALACALAWLPVAGCEAPESDGLPVVVLEVPAGCDLLNGCRTGVPELSLTVRFDEPARALQPFAMSVKSGGAQAFDSVAVTFSMRGMDMGLNRYRLQRAGPHLWEGSVTLPICVSGRSDWIAAVEAASATHRYRVDIPFVLEK